MKYPLAGARVVAPLHGPDIQGSAGRCPQEGRVGGADGLAGLSAGGWGVRPALFGSLR